MLWALAKTISSCNMDKIETIEQVIALISNRVEESTTLEYKSAIDTKGDAWKKELAKDVSAMAAY